MAIKCVPPWYALSGAGQAYGYRKLSFQKGQYLEACTTSIDTVVSKIPTSKMYKKKAVLTQRGAQ